MGDRPTLILTTRLGVRPLGVRGDPLHAVAGQLRAVIRRRLGDETASLLAEPQMHESGDGIDWYADRAGPVQAFAALDAAQQAAILDTIDTRLSAIRSLGGVLQEMSGSEEARLVGQSLALATVRPSDDFIFVVDGEPVIAAWGYESDALAALQPYVPPPVPVPAPPPPVVATPAPAAVLASAPAAVLPGRLAWAPWLSALLFGLMLLLLLLLTSWLLRTCAPVDPSLNVAMLETPAPPAPEAPPDPTPLLKASLDSAQGDNERLKAELAALETEIRDKVAMCKPVEPPKPPPPPVAKAPPPPQQQAAAPEQPKAPPINRPPPGQLPCNWSGDSGGEGVTRNKHYLGDKPGFVAINYNLYVKPDDIKVVYRGQVLAGTGGPRSGRGGFGFDWKPVAGDYSVDVIVTGEMWGTRWTYSMVCPR
ncbi:MAG: hypothetical protein LCH95_22775 [Proteobacteria bacterium]|nr:hypothetical protein [Pseudomonadota bacterium]